MRGMHVVLPMVLAAVLGGCGSGEEPSRKAPAAREPVLQESRPVTPELRARPLEREEYLRQAEARLQEVQRLVAEMQERLEKLSPELRARVTEQLHALEPKLATARRKLQELKFAAGETYRKLQAEVEALLEELKKAVEKFPLGFQFKP